MPRTNFQDLLEAGVHFGHLKRKWNPKMAPYIFMEKNGIHIIDLHKTVVKIDEAANMMKQLAHAGRRILFVATKKQAKDIVAQYAQSVSMPYVTERWPGGMLTNFPTIRKAVKKMHTIDEMISNGTFETLAKRERLQITRQRAKLEKNLGSISDLNRLPAALFVVDVQKEMNAVKEANRLNIPVIAVVDTCCDPTPIDYVIPGNDDAAKSISIILDALCGAIKEGLEERKLEKDKEEESRESEASAAGKKMRPRKGGKAAEKGGKATKEAGKKTGVITDKPLKDGTPLAFTAHLENRYRNTYGIAKEQILSGVDIMMGTGYRDFKDYEDLLIEEGYTLVRDKEQMISLDSDKFIGAFSNGSMLMTASIYPSIAEMAYKALEQFSKNEEGFFLLVESGQIDNYCGKGDIESMADKVVALDQVLRVSMNFAKENPETLIIVLADHETGGLIIGEGEPSSDWFTEPEKYHTPVNVPLFAYGMNSSAFEGKVLDNTEVFEYMMKLMGLEK